MDAERPRPFTAVSTAEALDEASECVRTAMAIVRAAEATAETQAERDACARWWRRWKPAGAEVEDWGWGDD